ncbi:WD40 repeat domain-containing protein [Streptomyces sp. R21]|uniref:WD40 repeat domain-containing protein n=1 Tax=Streptomyces sp. R21 TaxID=3238627 RepID=A0AB39PMZ9_9ACTN
MFEHDAGATDWGPRPEDGDGKLLNKCIYDLDAYVAPDTGHLCVVSVGLDGLINIRDVDEDVLLNSIRSHSGRILGVVFVGDGDERSVVAGGAERTVSSWNARTGELERVFQFESELFALSCLRLPSGSALVAAGDENGVVRILDTAAWPDARELNLRRPNARNLVTSTDLVSADGRLLVAVAQTADMSEGTGRVSVWDVLNGASVMDIESHDGGAAAVSWLALPDGGLLLASSGRDRVVRIWDVDTQMCLADFVLPEEVGVVRWASPGPDSAMLAAGCGDTHVHLLEVRWRALRQEGRAAPEGALFDVTAALGARSGERTQAVAWDAHPVTSPRLSAVRQDEADLYAAIAWSADGTVRHVIGRAGDIELWDPGASGAPGPYVLDSFLRDVRCLACAETTQGTLLAAGSGGRYAQVWDITQRESSLPKAFELVGAPVTAVALGDTSEGRTLVAAACAGGGARVRIWDVADGRLLAECSTASAVCGMAFTVSNDGRTVLAAGDTHHLYLWASEDEEGWIETRVGIDAQVRAVHWVSLSDGRKLLAAGLVNGRVMLWDFPDLRGPFVVDTDCGWVASIALAADSSNRVWLAVGGSRGWATYELRIDPPVRGADRAPVMRTRTVLPSIRSAAMPGLFALGQAGMWRPLGLLEDTLTLTATTRSGGLHDERRAVLREHAGVRRLRELDWPARARVALAGLLLVDADCGEMWVPPEGTGPAQWHAAFTAVSPAATGAERQPGPEVDALTAAADRVGERTVGMLTVLGPEVAAADPGLILRLIGRESDLPLLDAQGLKLLAAASLEQSKVTTHVGVATHVPGAIGVSRHGLPDQLLQTQLALPSEILTLRRLTHELLYRQHSAFVPPRPQPVTLVLDTTPPTFGGVESLLRLVGHLITTSLWQQGERPLLVTAGRPDRVVELTGPAQLMELWTSRTLYSPEETLAMALDTARAEGLPVVLLAHQHAPRPEHAPWLRLLATHHPGEPPAEGLSNGRHHFLPPSPPARQLVSTVRALLADTEGQVS